MYNNAMKMADAIEDALTQREIEKELGYCVDAKDIQRLLADMTQGG